MCVEVRLEIVAQELINRHHLASTESEEKLKVYTKFLLLYSCSKNRSDYEDSCKVLEHVLIEHEAGKFVYLKEKKVQNSVSLSLSVSCFAVTHAMPT